MAHRGSGAPLLVQLVMVHHSHGAPLVVLKKIQKKVLIFFTNGAPWMWCAITSLTSNDALSPGAPLLVLEKK